MPLQNRVDPFGEIHAVAARGTFTGNRGVIHDPETKMLLKRRWTTKAWIICDCDFRDRRRDVMGRNAPSGNAGWTELFFLDEITALAAGHRPCFYCRREKAREFADCFGKAFGITKPKVAEMDARLHAERLASGGKARWIDYTEFLELPDGVVVSFEDEILSKRSGSILFWSFYDWTIQSQSTPSTRAHFRVLTPQSTALAIEHGYGPVWREDEMTWETFKL